MTTHLRRGLTALGTIAIVLGSVLAVAATPASSATQPAIQVLTNIRTGLNTGFDRVVLDMSDGQRPDVRYEVTDELIQDGSGEIFWLAGEYFVSVVVNPAYAHDRGGNPSYPQPQRFRTRNLHNVMAVGLTGDFEGYVSIGLGIRYQSWVRVFTLIAPNRVVIDVGH
ncbi:MAG TPA: hypothetical protein VGR06_10560 [Actinophytocola sp.]|uniref:AMIN-like domain-containing (lipo)protein n=1 Tax=Actinophytocola sp. TaxID=1872138 RepID=UPI002DF92889|nr:hypothetical protein [Actinophytocola sp.]